MQHDQERTRYLNSVIESIQGTLGDAFLGFYLYGSLARDAFIPGQSDADALACTDNIRRWAEREVYTEFAANGVLNACRAWQYVDEGRLTSKDEGGEWALAHGGDRDVIEAALARYRSEDQPLPSAVALRRFFAFVLDLLEAAVP